MYFVLYVVNSAGSNTTQNPLLNWMNNRLWLEDGGSSEMLALILWRSDISTCWATNVIGDAGAADAQTCVAYVTLHPRERGVYPRLQFS